MVDWDECVVDVVGLSNTVFSLVLILEQRHSDVQFNCTTHVMS